MPLSMQVPGPVLDKKRQIPLYGQESGKNAFPSVLPASWRKGSEPFLLESERHSIPQLSHTVHYPKNQNKSMLKYQRENPGKQVRQYFSPQRGLVLGQKLQK